MQANQVLSWFEEATSKRGDRLLSSISSGEIAYAKSAGGAIAEARGGDQFSGGVAMRVKGDRATLKPYLFHLGCSQGVILSSLGEAATVALSENDPIPTLDRLLEDCSSPETFENNMEMLRQCAVRHDLTLVAVSMLSEMNVRMSHLVAPVLDAFERAGDETVYGLMHAMTAAASAQEDLDDQWRLEEMGGMVPALDPDPLKMIYDLREVPIELELAGV